MTISRREFLKRTGQIAAVSAVAPHFLTLGGTSTSHNIIQTISASLGTTEHIKTNCAHCVNFCGLSVKMVDGVIRTVSPDAERADYYNWGICPKGVSGIFNVYNPYRIKTPLKRTNPNKGPDEDPGWVEISWDEAFTIINDKLTAIYNDDPRKLIWQHGHGKYLIGDKFPKAFTAAFGTPNLTHRTTSCEAARHVADELTWGYHGHLPDVSNTKLLLNFGANYFEGEQWARWLDHSVTDAMATGMKLVAIEPRLSNLAGKADQWIPMKPAKDVVFLLGMAKILIDNGYIDEDFLVTYTNAPFLVGSDGLILKDGDDNPMVWDTTTESAVSAVDSVAIALSGSYTVSGETYRTGYQVLADNVADITPAYVEEVCGVPASTLTSLALEFGQKANIGATVVEDGEILRYTPVAIHTFRGLSAKEHGVQNSRAALIVNMLVGAIDAVGGLVLHSVYKSPGYMETAACTYPPKYFDLGKSVYYPMGTHNVAQQVALSLLDPPSYGFDYVPEMQIVYASNRVFSTAHGDKQIEAYNNIYSVVIDIVLSEQAWLADIVLPDLTYLESWHYAPTRYTVREKHYAIRQPVTNVYDIPHDGYSMIWEFAKRLGIRDEYIAQVNSKWSLSSTALETGVDTSAKDAVEKIWIKNTSHDFDYAIEHGFYGKKLSTYDAYKKGVESKFKGTDKPKMHFYCDELVSSYNKVVEVVNDNNITNIDLEKYEEAYTALPQKEHAFPTPHKEADGYDYYMITFKSMYRNQSGNTALNPILNEVVRDNVRNSVWLNPDAATAIGVRNGENVKVESRVGSIVAKANVTEGIRSDTVGMSYHYGQWSKGLPDYARKGAWINKILEQHPCVISGMDSFNDTKVRISKA